MAKDVQLVESIVDFDIQGGGKAGYLRALFLAALLVLSGVVAMNIAVDPREDFGSGLYPPLVVDVPKEKLEAWQAWPHTPETLVLGSSRVFDFNGTMVADAGFGRSFNYGLAAASPVDIGLVWGQVVDSGRVPKTIIIGVDPMQFIDEIPVIIDRSPVRAEYTGDPQHWGDRAARIVEAASSTYAKESLRVLYLAHIEGFPIPNYSFTSDGSARLLAYEAAVANGTFDLDAEVQKWFDDRLRPKYLAYDVPPADHLAAMQSVLTDAADRNITVYAFLPPLHPLAIALLDDIRPDWPTIHDEALARVLTECRPGFHAFDLTRIESFGGTAGAFRDSHHIHGANVVAVLDALREKEGDGCAA